MAPSKTRTIRLRVFIDTSPRKVFRALTEPKRLARWLLDEATLSPRKGARYTFRWEGGPIHTGRVVDFVRGKRITLTWQWPGIEDELTTKLRLTVEPKEGGTVLRFTHLGFPKRERWFDLYAGTIQGWTYFMMNLKSVLEHGEDLRSPFDW